MAVIIPPPHAYVKTKETVFSRGVFAGRAFKQGELIEICPIVEFSLSEKTRDFPKRLERAVFKWRLLTGNSTISKYCLVLGYGAVYEASQDEFNMVCKSDENKGVIGFFALRDIAKDEELVMDHKWRVKVSQMIPSNVGEGNY